MYGSREDSAARLRYWCGGRGNIDVAEDGRERSRVDVTLGLLMFRALVWTCDVFSMLDFALLMFHRMFC